MSEAVHPGASARPPTTQPPATADQTGEGFDESYFVASQWQLMRRKFVRHKLALVGLMVLAVLYFVAVFAEFFATQDIAKRNSEHIYAPPQRIRFFSDQGFSLRPFVYPLRLELNMETFRKNYHADKTRRSYIRLFRRGDEYELWSLFRSRIHLLGVDEGTLFLLGTDRFGRDLYSRVLYAARTSLSIGLIGVTMTFVLGCTLGGISGFFGGRSDMAVQRLIEFMQSIPTIPLWMALSAAMPREWGALQVYLAITIILSIVSWGGLARVVRGKLLQLREEDFVMAATISGSPAAATIARHLLPSFLSYLIVNLTLAVPGMILGETALSFLGLGLRPPVVSWGVLLEEAQKLQTVALHPWLLIPGLFVIVTVLAFNFVGDGLRDAADPYRN